jgi:hypothetical protein
LQDEKLSPSGRASNAPERERGTDFEISGYEKTAEGELKGVRRPGRVDDGRRKGRTANGKREREGTKGGRRKKGRGSAF